MGDGKKRHGTEPSPEFVAKVQSNTWHKREELDEFIATIKALSDPEKWDWSWARNTKCKYVELRFDMRDGGFVLRANSSHHHGPERISLDELKWQYSDEEAPR
jgi:hypothetical protein